MKAASQRAFDLLRARGRKVSFAESLTGGLIAAAMIENAGASAVINESYVTYAEEAKARILGVTRHTLECHGVVSENCAREMAVGVRRISRADYGVSATGLAGPDGGTDELPVGTVFIGVAGGGKCTVCRFRFEGDRMQVRMQAAKAAFDMLAEAIEQECV